ncbi:MAG: hypothetical protein J0652_02585 [Desulfobulbaceae bacterium]|nr:hypothetical protein [Desulfobulbaceae bacterium]
MAFTSGTATNYKDLLARMVTFATANGWAVVGTQTAESVYLKGSGTAGLDEIYVGIETYEDTYNNRYNWLMAGMWGWREGRTIKTQPRSSAFEMTADTGSVVGYFHNTSIPYWIACTPRRIILCANVGTTYQQIHLGFLTVPATDAQYPYPLFIGGSWNSKILNTSGTLYGFWTSGNSFSRLSIPGGAWGEKYPSTESYKKPVLDVVSLYESWNNSMLTAMDSSYLLDPIYVVSNNAKTIFGQIEGLYRVTGFNNLSENIITVGGVNYIVFQDGSRTGAGDYCALRMN